jgi:ABC-type amino acid transport substrate-binding protein
MLRKLLALLLLAALSITMVVRADEMLEPLPDLEGATITVAVENAYPPFNFIDEATGEAAGWDYDAVNEICRRLNCTPEYVVTSWDGLLASLGQGSYDMAADGITITAERDEVVDFSDGYITVAQSLLVRLDEDRFITAEEFAANGELRIGSQVGTTNYDSAIALVGEERVQSFDIFGVAVQALIAGDVDAVMIDNTAGQGYSGENADVLRLIETNLQSAELGFAFPEGSPLRDQVNIALAHMRADDTLAIINARWFPPQLPDLGGATITVAVENAYPPFNFIDEATGEAAGWDYDAVNEICRRLNCTPEYVVTSWDGLLASLGQGSYDMAADGITITAERDEVVDFSMGYITVAQSLLVRLDEDRFITAEEFAANGDLRIGSQVGTTNYDSAVALVGEERVQSFDIFGVAVQALIAGDVDAVMIDNTAGQGYTGENADVLRLIETNLQSAALGFAFPEGSPLRDQVNVALLTMKADGTLDEINARWFPPISNNG